MAINKQIVITFPETEEWMKDAITQSAIDEGLSISAYVRQRYRKDNPEKVLEFAKK